MDVTYKRYVRDLGDLLHVLGVLLLGLLVSLDDLRDLALQPGDGVGVLVDGAGEHLGLLRVIRAVLLARLLGRKVLGLLGLERGEHLVDGADHLAYLPYSTPL